MNPLLKINKLPPLRDQVCESIHRAILSGDISEGQRLTEGKLSTFLGVSRTPVREAMNMLQQKGVLRVRNSGGYEIFVPTAREVEETYEIRALIEPLGIESVAKLSNPQYLSELKEILNAEVAAHKSNDAGEFALKNLSFRLKLYEICANSMVRSVLEQFFQYLNYIAMITLRDSDVREIVLTGQQKIYIALEKGDPVLAKQAIKAYLKTSKKALVDAAARIDN